MHLFVHYEATRGAEPYLLKLEAQAGLNRFECIVRPPVTVQPPKGIDERKLTREGLEPRMVIPWIAQIAKTSKTVVVYDADHFQAVMDCELQRLGKLDWHRPGIEIIDLASKAKPIARIANDEGFKTPTFEEACMMILNQNANGLESVKALYEQNDVNQLVELNWGT